MSHLVGNLQARRFFIARQGLCDPPTRSWGKPGLYDAVERLGFVQVDSINTVERAHHHILFARNQTYRHKHLADLVEKDRSLFENWTHDASIIPTVFFPYWRHRFEHEKQRLRTRWKEHFGQEGFDRDLDRVLDRVAREGPLLARDFEGDKPSTGWWDWHPSKAALEYLWRTGELSISRRDGFQKVYDLTERVIPPVHRSRAVTREEFVDWACRSAIERLGIATRSEITAFWRLLSPAEVEGWAKAHRNELESLRIEGADGRPQPSLALAGTLDVIARSPEPPSRLRTLSPFDPLLRDRRRAERLFGFNYRIEVFVPEARRRYGYYVYPVLRGDRIVGRIDMKADRASDRLVVRAFWPEPRVRISAALLGQLEAELARVRRFAAVADVRFDDGWLREA